MKSHLITIGNSRGVRIPKIFIKKCGFKQYVNIDVTDNQLIISQDEEKRKKWEELFRKDRGISEKVDFIKNKFDDTEWEW